MASEIVLKPCPCCGGHATMEHGAERSENGWVVCMECGLSTRYHHDPAEAAAEWNRRACDAHHETPSTVHNGDCVPQTERNAAHEAVDDVIESMERFASRHWMHDEGQNAREFAARLKAALKRERASFDCECAGIAELAAKEEAARHKPGNAAAMREALNYIVWIAKIALNVNCVGNSNYSELWSIIDKCKSALSAPPRQCDVGTPEELGMRYKAFCRKHFTPDQLGGNCRKCPLKDRRGWSCQLAWAQTPYEAQEGGAD